MIVDLRFHRHEDLHGNVDISSELLNLCEYIICHKILLHLFVCSMLFHHVIAHVIPIIPKESQLCPQIMSNKLYINHTSRGNKQKIRCFVLNF